MVARLNQEVQGEGLGMGEEMLLAASEMGGVTRRKSKWKIANGRECEHIHGRQEKVDVLPGRSINGDGVRHTNYESEESWRGKRSARFFPTPNRLNLLVTELLVVFQWTRITYLIV